MGMKTNRITLLYVCPNCGKTSSQPLTDLVQNGTHGCEDCSVDMILQDEVHVEAYP